MGMGMGMKPNRPVDIVRELQRTLYRCAKRSRTRRFHALYDRIARSDVLAEAWKRVSGNGGAAGVDGETIAAIEGAGVEGFLAGIKAALDAGHYRPSPVRRRWILGLHRLQGSVCYPAQATPVKTIVKPCAGNPHARFERGNRNRACPVQAPRR